MNHFNFTKRFLICTILHLFIISAIAQVSLSSDHVIDIAVDGYENKFTVIRDGRDQNQWYYMPDMPRLVEKSQGGKKIPEFTLLRYQYHNDKDLEKLVEGGFLQFGVTAEIPTDAFTQIKEYLENRFGKAIKLGSVIFKSAQVSAYTPVNAAVNDSSTIMGAAGVGSGIAPVFSTQKMVFSFPYNKIGSNVINTLISSQTGIPVFVTLNYIGLTPKLGLKVEWDWQSIYNHYSSDEKFKASASYFGWVGASYEYSSQKIWDILTSDNSIRISGITGEGFNPQDLDKILQPILARINSEILAGVQPPEKIAPAVASAPSASGRFFSVGYSVAMKEKHEIKSGKGTFDFSVQNMVERTTVIGGFMGIGSYSKDVRDLLVLNSTEDDYKSASIILPSPLSNDNWAELKINKIDLSLSMINDDKESERQYVFTSAITNNTWQDKTKRLRYSIVIPLMNDWTKTNGAFKNTAVFSEKMNISTDLNYTLAFEKKYKAYTGDGSINSLSDNRFNIIEVNPIFLSFNLLDASEPLLQVTVQLEFDNVKSLVRTIKPIKEAGSVSFQQPVALKYIIPNISLLANINMTIKFYYKGGTIKSWKYNNQNLKEIESFNTGTIVLQPSDIL
jgi:hypothetical protein